MNEESRLIPHGWYLLDNGMAHGGDKYWDPRLAAWLPITTNSFKKVGDFMAVIRKKPNDFYLSYEI